MMNSAMVKTLLIGFGLMVGGTAFAQQTVRYVNMAKVFQGYYKTINSEQELKQQEEIYQERAKELAQEAEQLKQQRDTLQEQALNVALSENSRQKNRQQAREVDQMYNEKQRDLRQFLNEKQQELRKQYIDVRNTLSDELVTTVKGYAAQNKIDLILDISGMTNNMLPVVLHYSEAQEITDTILAEVNKGHEDELPVPDEEAGQ